MSEITNLQQRLSKIESRNKKVEFDKAWETSWTRRLLIVVFTYLLIGLYLSLIKISHPWLNAVIPSLGFLLSTLTLNWVKTLWIKRQ